MSKSSQQRNERVLNELRLNVEGNNICADCRSSQPRWASWNLGIFLCVRCATIHRSMGSHISKVKSLTLDTWTREQVDAMKALGNVRSNLKYNPDPVANPPPLDLENEERDSQLKRYIVRKYRDQAFVVKAKPDRPAPKRHQEDELKGLVKPPLRKPTPSVAVSAPTEPRRNIDQPKSTYLEPNTHPVSRTSPRAMTAPIPDMSRTPSPVNTLNGNNPFNRQMTASVIVSSSTAGQTAANPYTGNGYQYPQRGQTYPQTSYASNLSMTAPSSLHPVTPSYGSSVTTQSTGGVWDDLKGLSLSTPNQFPHHYAPSPTHSNQLSPALNGVSPGSYNTNPFLRNSSSFSASPSFAGTSVPKFQPQSQFGQALAAEATQTRNPFVNQGYTSVQQPGHNVYATSPIPQQYISPHFQHM